MTLELTLGLSNMSCDEYGSAEAAVVNRALASSLSGVSTENFGEHVCTAVDGRRRSLKDASTSRVTIAMTVAVDTAQVQLCLPTPTEGNPIIFALSPSRMR
jgi:hypothetical protein